MERSHIDRLLGLAVQQGGVISIEQANSLGISTGMIRSALQRGWLRRVRRGVYALPGVASGPRQHLVGALLSAGTESAVSHASAAAIHGFHGVAADGIEVTVPLQFRRRIEGIVVHRSSTLEPRDVVIRRGLRVTAPIRTVIDLAPRINDPQLEVIIDEGAIRRLWTAEQIAERLANRAGGTVRGSQRLRRLLDLRLGEGHPDSRLEQRVYRVLRPHVPPFVAHHQVVIDDMVIDMDMAWPEDKVDGEIDGLAIRAVSRTKFERQCRRENMLAAEGWRIIHFTAKMDDEAIIAQVARLLGPSRT